jgi:hypothetical protein
MSASHRRMFPAIALAVLSAAAAGCHVGGSPRASSTPSLTGKWEWIETTGGIAGIHKTPESSGERWTIQFTADGTYAETRDANPVETGRYSIEPRLAIADHATRPALIVAGRPDRIMERPDDHTLVLVDNVIDGFASTFTRSGN